MFCDQTENGYRYLNNIVLTQIKIHNMPASLATPLDSIRKLVLWRNQESRDTLTVHCVSVVELETEVREVFTIMEKGINPTSAFTLKNLLSYYAKPQ